MGLFVIGPLWLAFGLLVGTKFGRVISLIIGAMLIVSMINGPSPDQRAEAMKAGTFDCKAALDEIRDDMWAYCSGVYGEAQWQAMVDAKLERGWRDLAQSEDAAKAVDEAKDAELTALGQRAAKH